MKKQLFSISALFGAILMVSCNDGGNDNATTTDSTNTTTTTTTTDSTTVNAGATTDTSMARHADTSMSGNRATTAANVSETDRKFIMEAASGGMMEVQAGQLAAQNAGNDRVKSFGNMMVQDHTNANNELKALATSKNITLPDSMMTKHRKHIDMLKTKTGKDFDKAYMNMMVMDHNEDVSKFQSESKNAKDPDLKAFASKTVPVLRTHLDSAKAINKMK